MRANSVGYRRLFGLIALCLLAGVTPLRLGQAAAQRSVTPAAGQPPRPVSWLAVGDSYSSGHGTPGETGKCRRNDGAWPNVAREESAIEVAPDGYRFKACSGAVTEDIFGQAEFRQFDLVTFSMGGNDAGFADVIYRCIESSAVGTVNPWLRKITGCPSDDDVRAQIRRVGSRYTDFLRRIAGGVEGTDAIVNPGGNVVVVGYPALFADPDDWTGFSQLFDLCHGVIPRDDAALIRGWAGLLNQQIGAAVEQVNRDSPNDVHFAFVNIQDGAGRDPGDADLYEPDGEESHNLCAPDNESEWLIGPHPSKGFHPKLIGHRHTGELVARVLDDLDWSDLGEPPANKTIVVPTASEAPTIMVVVDTSGSMGESVAGGVKIEVARAALLDFLEGVERDSFIGLRSYPAADSGCDDGTLHFPVSQRDPTSMSSVIRTLYDHGGTPTAEALRAAADDLRASGRNSGIVILVSDGKSTCDDPCLAAEEIAQTGIDMRVLSVAFDVASEEGRGELECISNETGGAYVDVNDADELQSVFDELTGPVLDLSVEHPREVVAEVGVGPDGLATVTATVTNTGELRARNAITRITFDAGENPGIGAPTRALGNIEPGDSASAKWQFRPAIGLVGRTLHFDVSISADNLASDIGDRRQIKIVDAVGRDGAGPLLASAERIAVLGDSYSAGEGAGDYLDGTDTIANSCHVSPNTYLAPTLDIPDDLLLACSGAVTADIGEQVDELRSRQESGGPADAVFLTIGGNDAGFSSVAFACVIGPRACNHKIGGTPAELYALERFRGLTDWRPGGNRLVQAYLAIDRELNRREVVEQRGGRAPIVVPAYPRIVPGAHRACPSLTRGPVDLLTQDELSFVHRFVTRLNGAAEAATATARELGYPVFFVPTTENSFLPNHTVCDDQPYANGLETLETSATGRSVADLIREGQAGAALVPELSTDVQRLIQEVFHPNADGYEAITQSIIRWSLSDDGRAAADIPRERSGPATSDVAAAASAAHSTSSAALVADTAVSTTAGTSHPLRADGFMPGAPVEISINSTTVVLSIAHADESGMVETAVGVPHSLEPGPHTVRIEGMAEDGELRSLEVPLEVRKRAKGMWPLIVLWLPVLALLAGGTLRLTSRSATPEPEPDTGAPT